MVQKVAPVAHDVLAAQIAEKELRLQAEKEADRAWADSQANIVHYMKTIECNEMASKEARNRALREEWDAQLRAKGVVARNPQGPDVPYDPQEPDQKKRVHRGGSFLCSDLYCTRYLVGTRGKGESRTASNHCGFRCVRGVLKTD